MAGKPQSNVKKPSPLPWGVDRSGGGSLLFQAMERTVRVAIAAALALVCGVSVSSAQTLAGPAAGWGTYAPRVPVSALARPMAWFDPSRFHVSTSVSMGSGFGSGVNALQVTSLSYRFAAPLWMNVSVGNAWGPERARSNSSFFLEGFDVGYRPLPLLQIQVHYRDYRSPLQMGSFGPWGERLLP